MTGPIIEKTIIKTGSATGITEIVRKQKKFFKTGKTKNIYFRLEQLNNLKIAIIKHEQEILKAVADDLNKPPYEAYGDSFYILLEEIKYTVKNLKKWAKDKKVKTPMLLFKSKSFIHYEPYGNSLIIGSWNVPFTVTILPLIASIAAGNCAVVKPSEIAANSSSVLKNIIQSAFKEEYISVIEGGVNETTELLNEKFDLIIYTGNTKVGKIIAESAVKNLTPVILELGGKSPCIVHKDANPEIAARRITWAKFINAGQICTSPDYLLIHKDIKTAFINILIKTIKEFYSSEPQKSSDYCRIINERHFDRLSSLLSGNIIFGGETDKEELYISPTIIDDVSWNDKIMEDEIFGPLLPVIEYENLDDIIIKINEKERPLSLYIYTENKETAEKIIQNTSSGGACINASVLHFLNRHLPFGGVGNSGMGNYRGKFGFESFSHKKSVLNKSTKIDMKAMYAPYKDSKMKMLKRFIKSIM